MKQKLEILGTTISQVEVSFISQLGIWLLINEKEYYLPYNEFPWFRNASADDINDVTEVAPNHFYWKNIDVDLTLERIINPQNYLLKSRT